MSPTAPTAPTVSLIHATSYETAALRESIESVLAPLGGISAFVKPGDRVLLKPNLLTGARPTKECVTRQELVRCVAELVIEAGGKPFFGDSPASITSSATHLTNSWRVTHSLVGRAPVNRLGLSRTRSPGLTKALMPPSGARTDSIDSLSAAAS